MFIHTDDKVDYDDKDNDGENGDDNDDDDNSDVKDEDDDGAFANWLTSTKNKNLNFKFVEWKTFFCNCHLRRNVLRPNVFREQSAIFKNSSLSFFQTDYFAIYKPSESMVLRQLVKSQLAK